MEPTKAKPRPKRRVLQEEEFNRDGHWLRAFTVRQEIWPIIEHWASEHNYRLVAMKGKKRTYQRNKAPGWFTVVVDMKQIESEFRLSAWIQVGFTARAINLFSLPKELPIEATGWKGISVRRKACSELNVLLERLRQAAIADSLGFHIADLDGSTRSLALLTLLPVFYFLFGTFRSLDSDPLATLQLMRTASTPFLALAGVALAFIAFHHFFTTKKFSRLLWKSVSVGVGFSLFSVLSVFLLSYANLQTPKNHFMHNCFNKERDSKCNELWEKLSLKDKEGILERMKEISSKPRR